MRRELIGLGHRPALAGWLAAGVADVECLELTAEHFFDAPDEAIVAIGARYPCSVHGLGLSLGTPGPLDASLVDNYARVARLSAARWATEHVAFTCAAGIDLGHLNPIAPTRENLALADGARSGAPRRHRPSCLPREHHVRSPALRRHDRNRFPERAVRPACTSASCWM